MKSLKTGSGKLKRVHQKVNETMAVQLPFVVDDNGNYQDYPVTTNRLIPVEKVRQSGCVCVGEQKPFFNNLFNNQNLSTMRPSSQKYPSMNLNGVEGESAAFSGGLQGMDRLLTIGIANAEATTETLAIGDGFQLGKDKLNIPAQKAGITITGTYGANTLTKLAEITKSSPYLLKGIQVSTFTTADVIDATFFTNGGSISRLEAEPDFTTVRDVPLPFGNKIKTGSYNTHIYDYESFQMLMDGFNGLKVVIPNGKKVVVVFHFEKVQATYLMKNVVK